MRTRALPLLLAVLGLAACGSRAAPPTVHAVTDSSFADNPDSSEASADTGAPPPPAVDSGITCTTPGATWALMDEEPIFLADPSDHRHVVVGGVDFSGSGGSGITIMELAAKLCPGSPRGMTQEIWGVSFELRVDYDAANFRVNRLALYPGYYGVMSLPTDPKGPDAGHTFTVGLRVLERDHEPFYIDWNDVGFTLGNELFNAMQYGMTSYPGYESTPCIQTGACAVTSNTTERTWTINTVSTTLHFDVGDTQTIQNTVKEIQIDL